MATLDCLLVNIDLLNPVFIIDLTVNLLLSSLLGVSAAELGRAPHFVGVELVGAAVLVAVASGWVVDAVEKGVAGLEAQLAVEVVPVEVPHEMESIVTLAHFFFVFIY